MASNNDNGDLSLEQIDQQAKNSGKKTIKKVKKEGNKVKRKAEKKIQEAIKKKIKEQKAKKLAEEAKKKVVKKAGEKVVTEAGKKVATEAGKQAVIQGGTALAEGTTVAATGGTVAGTTAAGATAAGATAAGATATGATATGATATGAAATGGTVVAGGAAAGAGGTGLIAFFLEGGWIILVVIAVILLIIWLVFVILGLINVIGYYTQTERYRAETQTSSIIYLDDNGKYNINDTIIDNVLKDFEGKDIEGTKKLFNKYVKAEVITMFPKLPKGFLFWGQNEVNGKVIIKRQIGDDEAITLTYEKYEDLEKMVNNNDKEAMNYFSLREDPDTKKWRLMIPIKEAEVRRYDINGNEISDEETGVKLKFANEENGGLDYQSSLEPYCLPFEFFLALHYTTGNLDFMNDLVNEVLKDDNQIVLTYIENTEETTTTYSWEGTKVVYKDEIKGLVDNVEFLLKGYSRRKRRNANIK